MSIRRRAQFVERIGLNFRDLCFADFLFGKQLKDSSALLAEFWTKRV